MVPGVEREKYAAGHEMLNQRSEKRASQKQHNTAISVADPNPLSTGWLLGQIQRNLSPGPPEAAIGINLPRPFGLSTIKTIKDIKKTTPTHTLGEPRMIAWHPPCLLMCGDFGKSLSRSSIEHDYHLQAAGFFLVHRLSRGILGSQNALIAVGEVLRLWPAVIAALPSFEPPQLSNMRRNYSWHRTVFSGTLLVCRTDTSLVSQEPQIQSVWNGALP